MKIISKFKDYYDFVQGRYGTDPKCVFDRTKKIKDSVNQKLEFNFSSFYDRDVYDPVKTFAYRFLVICGKYYPLIAPVSVFKSSDFRLVVEEDLDNDLIYNTLLRLLPIKAGWFAKKDKIKKIMVEHLTGKGFNRDIIELSKKLRAPIFVIISYNRYDHLVIIDELQPNLSKIKGVPSILPPEVLFNDISFFIGNVLTNNVDTSHLIVSDKDKIVKGGFDLKTSFRGK